MVFFHTILLILSVFFANYILPSASGGLLDAFNILGNGVNSGQILTNNPLVEIASSNIADKVGGSNTALGVIGAGDLDNGLSSLVNTNRYQQQVQPNQYQQYQNLQQQRYPNQRTYPNQMGPAPNNQAYQNHQLKPQSNQQNLQSTVDEAQKLLERLQELNRIKDQQKNQKASNNQNIGSSANQNSAYYNNNGQMITDQASGINYANTANTNQQANFGTQFTENSLTMSGQQPNSDLTNKNPDFDAQNIVTSHVNESYKQIIAKKLRVKKFFYQAKPVVPENEITTTEYTLFYYD